MPTMELGGVTVTLDAAGMATAQRWQRQLEAAAAQLVSAGTGADARIQPALSTTALSPVVEGMVSTVQGVEALFQTLSIPSQPSSALTSAVQSVCGRYAWSVLEGLNRVLVCWESIGPLFFRRGFGPSREAYALDQLKGLTPESDALEQGGSPTLQMHLLLKRVEGSGPGDAQAQGLLTYVPRDVEGDALMVGDTSQWCKSGGEYRPADVPCDHPWCRSLSELLNVQLGDADAMPTLKVWPAMPGSSMTAIGAEAYGFREAIRGGASGDVQVSSASSPEVSAFYRILGRQLALAFGMGASPFDLHHFTIRQRRPIWVATPCLFGGPFQTLADTGAFEVGSGPLAPPAKDAQGSPVFSFGLQVTPTQGATAPIPIPASTHVSDVVRGCREGFEAMGVLASSVRDRLLLGPDICTLYAPRPCKEQQVRQGLLLEALSTLSGSSDWDVLDSMIATWQQQDREAWSGYWLGKGLDAVNSRLRLLSNPPPPDLMESLAPWTDRLAALAGVQTFSLVTLDSLLLLDVPDRIQAWDALESAASMLADYQGEEGWDPGVNGPRAPQPAYALAPFELADHLRAQIPFQVRRLQGSALWSVQTGEEVRLDPATAPPPRLQRSSYFARPAVEGIASQWARLGKDGVRLRLVGSVSSAMNT